MGHRYSEKSDLHYMDHIDVLEIILCPQNEYYLYCHIDGYGTAMLGCTLEILMEIFNKVDEGEEEILEACSQDIMKIKDKNINIVVSDIVEDFMLNNLILILEKVEEEIDEEEDVEQDAEAFLRGNDLPDYDEFKILSIVVKNCAD